MHAHEQFQLHLPVARAKATFHMNDNDVQRNYIEKTKSKTGKT